MQKTLFNLSDGITKGKGVDAISGSRATRNDLIAYFGGKELLPSSVMTAKRMKTSAEFDAPGHERSYSATSPLTVEKNKRDKSQISSNDDLKDIKNSKSLRAAMQVSGSGAAAGNISTFWQDVGGSMLKLYTKPGDTVVDPFAGHNSRMELCVKNGRHYHGHDLSQAFMKFNRKRAKELRAKFPEVTIELFEGDSRSLQCEDGIGDFSISSPPYWDIEYYGDEKDQLGNNTYEEFLDGMQLVFNSLFDKLKPGAFVAWFVNDFRRKGKFYPYHMHSMQLAEKAGFLHRDMLIVDLGRGFGDVFVNQYVQNKMLPKRHEYGIIFQKPKPKKKDE